MRTRAFLGVLLLSVFFMSSSCITFLSKIPKTTPIDRKETKVIIPAHPIFENDAISVSRFIEKNKTEIISFLALFSLWLLVRFYNIVKKRQDREFSMEDIALPKIIKDNAAWIWERHRPGRNVISIERWKDE